MILLPEDLKQLKLTPQCKFSFLFLFFVMKSNRNIELIPLMGYTEIIESDYPGVVDAACIEDRCNMHQFNDKLTTAFAITHRSWFTRFKVVNWDKNPRILVHKLHRYMYRLLNEYDCRTSICTTPVAKCTAHSTASSDTA